MLIGEQNLLQMGNSNETTIVTDGRLLIDYYNYDYQNAFSVASTSVIAMVIKRQVAPFFSYHMLRIYNLMTHADSIIYRDFLIDNVTECISISIEDDNSESALITFSLLCDSTILKYVVSLREDLTINTAHPYWQQKDAYLVVNVSQDSVYHGYTSSTYLPLKVKRENHDLQLHSVGYITGFVSLSVIGLGALIIVKYFLSE